MNNIIIDTLEGQIITLLVVTAFILVFLIREWVMQQQQNLMAGPNGDVEEIVQNPEAPVQHEAANGEVVQGGADVRQLEIAAEGADNGNRGPGHGARILARPRRRLQRRHTQAEDAARNQQATVDGEDPEIEEAGAATASISPQDPQGIIRGSTQRPAMPDRDVVARAVEIQRTLEEKARASGDQGWSGAVVFKDLWERAENRPSEVLRIIREEGRNEELGWLVKLMSDLEDAPASDDHRVSTFSAPRPSETPEADYEGDDERGFYKRESRRASKVFDTSTSESTKTAIAEQNFDVQGFREMSLERQKDAIKQHLRSAAQHSAPTQLQDLSSGQTPQVPRNVLSDDSGPDLALIGATLEDQPMVVHTGNSSPAKHHVSDFNDQEVSTHRDLNQHDFLGPDSQGLVEDSALFAELNTDVPSDSREQGPRSASSAEAGDLIAQDVLPDSLIENTQQAQGFMESVKNWLWGGVALPLEPAEPQVGDDEHVVNDIADEEPFVPVAHGQPLIPGLNDAGNPAQDAEVVAAAAQAGIDPNEAEAADDIEDLEGIMELVGMQGPLAGLMQNGMFCAVLVSLTIFFGVWIPYMSGKMFLSFLANPIALLVKLPLRLASSSADMLVDICIFGAGCAFYWLDKTISVICAPVRWAIPPLGRVTQNKLVAQTARSYAESALERLAQASFVTGTNFSEGCDVPTFSVVAHESLQFLETQASMILHVVYDSSAANLDVFRQSSGLLQGLKIVGLGIARNAKALTGYLTYKALDLVSSLPVLLRINPLRFNLAKTPRVLPFDYDLASWDATDRTLAILSGYLFFALLGVLYLKIAAAVHGTSKKGRVNGALAEVLYQAGGVMKVILIISIEMIVFPLYCGLLLDVAMLPLFGNATIMSRVAFTMTSPNTSIFIHWFVGTCYMFHFALFVSMCRKIMRSGVLCKSALVLVMMSSTDFLADFIRDPDDPTFHPVRDVLERSVSSQLWKISFSALVYGGLVLVCLGGVVWGISLAFPGLFPIHWSSNEPVLEFPVDLLFYNFLMPLLVKSFRPSKGLNTMYGWWFRKCARSLRLTNFLFGDKRDDEEGRHVRRTWTGALHGRQGDVQNPVIGNDRQVLAEDRDTEAFFLREGKYVRAPASDQVRIPKNALTFVEVDEDNNRVDGVADSNDGLHGRTSELFAKVYIPPYFRIRISLFVFLIWLFAATTGVSITVVPLIFGRFVFAKLTPNHLHMNDIYAFSIGIYILGGVAYGVLKHRTITTLIHDTLTPHTTTITSTVRKGGHITLRVLSLLYTYSAFGIFLPALFSFLIEFYVIIPLHTYFTNAAADSPSTVLLSSTSRPIIHLIQDWTLGVLYIKMFARLILWNAPSRPARALRSIVRRGWLDPDVRLATRAFILPATLTMAFALVAPLALGWTANNTALYTYSKDDAVFRSCVYRYSYPAVLGVGCAAGIVFLLHKAFAGWRRRVRDEVYLIGERLHNFGEGKRKGMMSKVRAGKRPAGID